MTAGGHRSGQAGFVFARSGTGRSHGPERARPSSRLFAFEEDLEEDNDEAAQSRCGRCRRFEPLERRRGLERRRCVSWGGVLAAWAEREAPVAREARGTRRRPP